MKLAQDQLATTPLDGAKGRVEKTEFLSTRPPSNARGQAEVIRGRAPPYNNTLSEIVGPQVSFHKRAIAGQGKLNPHGKDN